MKNQMSGLTLTTQNRELWDPCHASAYCTEAMRACSLHELQSARELVADASDAELLGAMAAKKTDMPLAQAALEEFIKRHRLAVYRICSNLVDRYGTASGWEAEEFAKAVFDRIFKAAHTHRDIDGQDKEKRLWRLKGWMGKIANSALVDKHRRSREVLFDDQFLAAVDDPEPPTDFPSRIHQLICDGVRQLPDRERLVMLRTLRFIQATKHQRLPNNVCKELRDTLHTTSANIRQIRKRAKNNLKAYFSQRGEDIRIFD